MTQRKECIYCVEKESIIWDTQLDNKIIEIRPDGEPIPLVFSDDIGKELAMRIEQGLLWCEYRAEDGSKRLMNAIAPNYCPICGRLMNEASIEKMDKQTIEGY